MDSLLCSTYECKWRGRVTKRQHVHSRHFVFKNMLIGYTWLIRLHVSFLSESKPNGALPPSINYAHI
ncbi:Uncharacterized protein APZ42_032328 [Daphnia magna]|uniref:Uncharacterized protein n=1 Tax=Daphnia magna TaxID=35525 RepID=A0A164M3G7_9CRUS|nr:Uncharacterized protein APZ42_032328 [Daphnia magna]